MARPSPRLAPVTRTLRIAALELAARRNRERRYEVDRRRNLVPGQARAAMLLDLVLERARIPCGGGAGEHYVRDDQGAGDWALAPPHQRQAHMRVRIDHRLDLFRMDLLAAD